MAFSIKSIAPRLFNSSKYETSVARNSNPIGKDIKNPFKSDMKMDVLTADVFGTGTKNDLTTSNSVISKTKRMCSTFVGSIANIGNSIQHAFESIGAFYNRMKNGAVGFWNKLNETEVPNIFDATRAIKTKWDAKNYDKDVQKLAATPVSDLENMLVKELSLNTAA